jgi:hypothetical protein
MHKVATKYDDPQMTDFLEGEFLKEQVKIFFGSFVDAMTLRITIVSLMTL